jgi:hypothetical protein
LAAKGADGGQADVLGLGWGGGAVGGQLGQAVAGEGVGGGLALRWVVGGVQAAVGGGDLIGATAPQGRLRVRGDGVEDGLDEWAAGRVDRVAERRGQARAARLG